MGGERLREQQLRLCARSSMSWTDRIHGPSGRLSEAVGGFAGTADESREGSIYVSPKVSAAACATVLTPDRPHVVKAANALTQRPLWLANRLANEIQNPCKSQYSCKRSVLELGGRSGERREGIAAGVGGEQLGEVAEERAALEAAGERGGEGAFDEAFAVVRAAAVGEFAVDDGPAERAFGGVVGRLDSLDGDERPECGPDLEQLVCEDA